MSNYRGRFAPSPTGPLHFGSLFAAVISYLHARAQGGEWLVRIEDLDPPREQAEAKSCILRTLESHGLEWDESVVYQSQRSALYESRLAQLAEQHLSFLCPCSRKELASNHGQHISACQSQHVGALVCATKCKAQGVSYSWQDEFQGSSQCLVEEDFVLKRKEGLYAYQLAVVSDDIEQKISHVVRGYDLLSSTPMQLHLYKAFDYPPPVFAHFPVIVHRNGQKLSKQNRAPAVHNEAALTNLLTIYNYLGLELDTDPAVVSDAIKLGVEAWKRRIPRVLQAQQIEQL